MYKILRGFGLGLLYALLSPFMIAAFVIIAIFYGIPNFIVKLVKLTLNFFKGEPLFPPFEEDIKAEEILTTPVPAPAPAPAPQPATTNVYLQTNWYPGQAGFQGPGVAPQKEVAQQVPPQPQQPQFIDAQSLPNEPDPVQIPQNEQPIFGGDLLTQQKEDEQ